jgi:hypothetical protein
MKRNQFWPLIIHPPMVNPGTHEKKSVLASNNTFTNGEPRPELISFHVCLGSPLVDVLLETRTAFFSCVPGFTTGGCIIRGQNCFLLAHMKRKQF